MDPDQKDQFKYGVNTNVKTKDQMVSIFYDYVITESQLIYSSDLINQLSIIEKRSNGSVSAKHGYHDDLFMASCLCAYVKKKTILDSTYLTVSKVKLEQIRKEEDNLFNNVVIGNNISKNDNIDVFASERELLKQFDDFDDFTF